MKVWGILLLVVAAGTAQGAAYRHRVLSLPGRPTDLVWVDLDGDGPREVLVEDEDAVGVLFPFPRARERPAARLPGGGRGFLYDAAPVDGKPGAEVVVLDAGGARLLGWRKGAWEVRRRWSVRPEVLPARPLRARLLRDLDGDGRTDLLLPLGARLLLFRGQGGGRFAPPQALPSGLVTRLQVPAGHLDGQLEASFSIPDVTVRDVDGDGRPDLLARSRSGLTIYRGRAEGGFARRGAWVLKLTRFRRLALEGAVAMPPQLYEDDLDGDGYADFLVTAGRQVWLFFAGKGFRGFARPDRIYRVAEDVAAVFTADVEGDGRTDLVVLKFELPSLARVVASLFVGLDLRLTALAFRNHGGRRLSTTPERTRTLTFAVPPLLRVLANLDRFRTKAKAARRAAARVHSGDLDGDGVPDLAVVTPDGRRLRLYRCRPPGAVASLSRAALHRLVREFLFPPADRTWGLEELLDYAADLKLALNRKCLAGNEPTAELELPPVARERHREIRIADVDGDRRGDVIVRVRRQGSTELHLYLSRP